LFTLAGLVAVALIVLAGGLAWRQLFLKSTYVEMDRKQSLRRILQPAPRGRILDRNGNVLVDNHARLSVVLYVDELRREFRDEFNHLRTQWLAQQNDDTTETKPTINSNELNKEARRNVALRYLDQANKVLGRNDTLDTVDFERHVGENILLPYTLISDISPAEYARFNAQMPVESPLQTNVQAARYYKYGRLAFHTLGYVGFTDDINGDFLPGADLPKNNNYTFPGMVGKNGLEKSFNDPRPALPGQSGWPGLSGSPGGEIWKVDPSASLCERLVQQIPQRGTDFVCSLDLNLQRASDAGFHGPIPRTGAAVALDVRTGEVLAMSSTPDFNLNDTSPAITNTLFQEISAVDGGWENRATQGLYPAGSTFKIVDTIAGLRAGMLNGTDTMLCPNALNIGGRLFKEDIYPQSLGTIGLVTAIQKSCDVYFYQFGMDISDRDPFLLAKEAHRLGFGQRTGIELGEPAERNLIIPDPAWKKANRPKEGTWSHGDAANLAVGQGYVQVTPLQMACFIASVARNETRTIPTLIHNPDPNAIVDHHAEPLGLTPDQRKLLLEGMEAVTNTGGTGLRIHHDPDDPTNPTFLPGIRVAGKTGTAQRTLRGKAGTIAWFICFAPIENPRIAVAVAVESLEQGELYGGTISAPIVRSILEEYFKDHPDALPPKPLASPAKK